MYKLIVILAAAMPIVLFLKKVFFDKSKIMQEASSSFRRQVDYLVWTILIVAGCGIAYFVGKLVYEVWK